VAVEHRHTDGVNNPSSAQVKLGATVAGYTTPAQVGMVGRPTAAASRTSRGNRPADQDPDSAWSWNTLNSSLYPTVLQDAYGSLLLLDLVTAGRASIR